MYTLEGCTVEIVVPLCLYSRGCNISKIIVPTVFLLLLWLVLCDNLHDEHGDSTQLTRKSQVEESISTSVDLKREGLKGLSLGLIQSIQHDSRQLGAWSLKLRA